MTRYPAINRFAAGPDGEFPSAAAWSFDLASLSAAEHALILKSGRKSWWRTRTGWRRQGDKFSGNAAALASLEARGVFIRFFSAPGGTHTVPGLRLTPLGLVILTRMRIRERAEAAVPPKLGASA